MLWREMLEGWLAVGRALVVLLIRIWIVAFSATVAFVLLTR